MCVNYKHEGFLFSNSVRNEPGANFSCLVVQNRSKHEKTHWSNLFLIPLAFHLEHFFIWFDFAGSGLIFRVIQPVTQAVAQYRQAFC
jgi:hypothetical protein